MSDDQLKYILEALLFASDKPLSAEELREAFTENISLEEIRQSAELLKADYQAQGRGFQLAEIAGGYQLVTDPRFASYLKQFYQEREKKKLSQATLETLSIVAYRQPVTRADIEFIRGVNVDGALGTLLEKELVKVVGRKEVPGRPMLYGTTDRFLEHFGLNSVKDLPALPEFTEKDLDPNLLPPQMRQREEIVFPETEGQQRAMGCDNEEEATREENP
jgi:segregation and condensation protein B